MAIVDAIGIVEVRVARVLEEEVALVSAVRVGRLSTFPRQYQQQEPRIHTRKRRGTHVRRQRAPSSGPMEPLACQ